MCIHIRMLACFLLAGWMAPAAAQDPGSACIPFLNTITQGHPALDDLVQQLPCPLPDSLRHEGLRLHLLIDGQGTVRRIHAPSSSMPLARQMLSGLLQLRFEPAPAGGAGHYWQQIRFKADSTECMDWISMLPGPYSAGSWKPTIINLDEVRAKIGYPEPAHNAGIEGYVLVKCRISADGYYQSHQVLRSSHPIFLQAVEAEIPAIRFVPVRNHLGKYAEFYVNLPFLFSEIDDRNRTLELDADQVLFKRHNPELALRILNRLCKVEPGRMYAQAMRAYALQLLDREAEALEAYGLVRQLVPYASVSFNMFLFSEKYLYPQSIDCGSPYQQVSRDILQADKLVDAFGFWTVE